MDFKFWKKKEVTKPVSAGREWINAITFSVVVATLFRWTIAEAFVIPTPSMENSMLVGDYLAVSKIHFGTRTTDTPLQIPLTHQKIWGTEIPSYLTWIKLPAYRLPGLRKINREEVVVFNVPGVNQNEGVEHPISLKNNYVKRCVALPGDELTIRDNEVFVNGKLLSHPAGMKFSYLVTSKDEINKRNLDRFDLDSDDYYFMGRNDQGNAVYKMFLTKAQVEEVKSAPYVMSLEDDYTRKEYDGPVFPASMQEQWSGDNYGSLVIPAKGMKIDINPSTIGLYGETIRLREHVKSYEEKDGKLFIDGNLVSEYTFRQDYYFMMGDNRHNSLDSRYWGFVPDDHIVGKPVFVWMSIDSEASLLHKIRWSRIFKTF